MCQLGSNLRNALGRITWFGPGANIASFAPMSITHSMASATDGRIWFCKTGNSHSVLYPPKPRLTTSARRKYVCCNAGPKDGVEGSKHLCIRLYGQGMTPAGLLPVAQQYNLWIHSRQATARFRRRCLAGAPLNLNSRAVVISPPICRLLGFKIPP